MGSPLPLSLGSCELRRDGESLVGLLGVFVCPFGLVGVGATDMNVVGLTEEAMLGVSLKAELGCDGIGELSGTRLTEIENSEVVVVLALLLNI